MCVLPPVWRPSQAPGVSKLVEALSRREKASPRMPGPPHRASSGMITSTVLGSPDTRHSEGVEASCEVALSFICPVPRPFQ